jgi:pimeloyl-ACP methyl ester carboxylesterase
MRIFAIVVAWLVLTSAAVQSPDPFVALSEAYHTRNAEAAAAVYTPTATVIYRYDGAPEERHVGTAAITRSFQQLFDQIDANDRIDLNFRITERNGSNGTGLYRLRIGNALTSYGRFAVTFGPDGRFSSDISTTATLADFENERGPVLVRPDDESIDRGYYAEMTGRYRLPNGCRLIVTRSVVRLVMRNSCTGEWRALNRVSGREWTAGDRVRSEVPRRTVRFPGQAQALSVEIVEGNRRTTALREDAYRTEDIAFRSADGTALRGTLYLPLGNAASARPRAASVLVHGSGPQDRDGYASIIAVLADELAANGRIVLTYDKRGSGQSAGNGDRAGFEVLADDAIAAMRALAQRGDVDSARIGLAGSSQAGWVAARAVQRYSEVADVLLLGAAGSAMTVLEQNLYNTEVRMRCAGIDPADIMLALDQQRAFFAFLADPAQAPALDALTRRGESRPGLADWLFPDSAATDRSAGQWFTVLDPHFDPRPVWRQFAGHKLFLFAQYDDSTPTVQAMARSRADGARVQQFRNAQHLGLTTTNICRGEISDLNAFSPGIFTAIARFARASR